MKILVIGGGGREHAIIKKLAESDKKPELFCAPGNGGISEDAVCIPFKATDKEAAVKFAIKKVDQACAKNLLHKNNAARKKSALAKLLAD